MGFSFCKQVKWLYSKHTRALMPDICFLTLTTSTNCIKKKRTKKRTKLFLMKQKCMLFNPLKTRKLNFLFFNVFSMIMNCNQMLIILCLSASNNLCAVCFRKLFYTTKGMKGLKIDLSAGESGADQRNLLPWNWKNKN